MDKNKVNTSMSIINKNMNTSTNKSTKRSFNSDENINEILKSDIDCRICFLDIKHKKKSLLPCGHFFCTICINEYIKANKKITYNCPVCRCKFTKINITNVCNEYSFIKKSKIIKQDENIHKYKKINENISINEENDKINPKKMIVKSFTNSNNTYICNIIDNTCTCPHFTMRNVICKHLKKCYADYENEDY